MIFASAQQWGIYPGRGITPGANGAGQTLNITEISGRRHPDRRDAVNRHSYLFPMAKRARLPGKRVGHSNDANDSAGNCGFSPVV